MPVDSISWYKAKNLLLTGIAKRISYVPGQCMHNSYELIDGEIHRRYEVSNSSIPVGSVKIGEPQAANQYKFYVSEWS